MVCRQKNVNRNIRFTEEERHQKIEAVITASGAKITHHFRGNAYYKPSKDEIFLPHQNQFKTMGDYYAVALHELGHWTGHKSRLNRDIAHPFGSEGYAREELRAEIASFLMMREFGVGHDPERHAAYVGSWKTILKDDPNIIVKAANDAEKIVQYISNPLIQEQAQEQEKKQTHETIVEVAEVKKATNKRVLLAIPFNEKEEAKVAAKSAGILITWDKETKTWYADAGVDLSAMKKWQLENRKVERVSNNPEQEFSVALKDYGFVLNNPPIMDGHLHRCMVDGDKPGNKGGAYVGHLDGHPAGFIHNHRTGESHNWKSEHPVQKLSAMETEKAHQEIQAKNKSREEALTASHKRAAEIAESVWKEAIQATTEHPYCKLKSMKNVDGLKVVPEKLSDAIVVNTHKEIRKTRLENPMAAIFVKGDLLAPVRDFDDKLWSIQAISTTAKTFMKGGKKTGNSVLVGTLVPITEVMKQKEPVVFAEGVATAETVTRALNQPVVAVLDSGNMMHVVTDFRQRNPDTPIVIAADNDRERERNVGVETANQVALSIGAKVVIPEFDIGQKGSDWNDLEHVSKNGILALKAPLNLAVSLAQKEMKLQVQERNKYEQAATAQVEQSAKQPIRR